MTVTELIEAIACDLDEESEDRAAHAVEALLKEGYLQSVDSRVSIRMALADLSHQPWSDAECDPGAGEGDT